MDRVNNDYNYIRISPTEMIDSILNEICTLMSPILNGICTLTSPVFNIIYTLMSPILNSIMYIVLCTCIHICISIGQKTDFNTIWCNFQTHINTVFVDSCCSIISLMCSVCGFVLLNH
jgi:type IV secretory pathway VirB3-like protein